MSREEQAACVPSYLLGLEVGQDVGRETATSLGKQISALLQENRKLAAERDQLAGRLAQQSEEPVAYATHHDEPMLFPTKAEAAEYCEDDEGPIPLYTAPQPAQPGWQTIETAPKDDGHILLYGDGVDFTECVFVGYWCSGAAMWLTFDNALVDQVSHWMPLLAAPKQGDKP